jgi:hypothetical protein
MTLSQSLDIRKIQLRICKHNHSLGMRLFALLWIWLDAVSHSDHPCSANSEQILGVPHPHPDHPNKSLDAAHAIKQTPNDKQITLEPNNFV